MLPHRYLSLQAKILTPQKLKKNNIGMHTLSSPPYLLFAAVTCYKRLYSSLFKDFVSARRIASYYAYCILYIAYTRADIHRRKAQTRHTHARVLRHIYMKYIRYHNAKRVQNFFNTIYLCTAHTTNLYYIYINTRCVYRTRFISLK